LKEGLGVGWSNERHDMKSEFLKWFIEQHKARHNSGMPNHTDQQLRDMLQAGKVAERVLACRELWDEKQQSALYAWTAAVPPNV
jgi:hypothetical protein